MHSGVGPNMGECTCGHIVIHLTIMEIITITDITDADISAVTVHVHAVVITIIDAGGEHGGGG
jgi:hypothetical protein